MTHEQITDKHSYFADGYIVMDVELPDMPDTIEVEGHTLQRKHEFHVTMVSVKQVKDRPDFDELKDKVKQVFVDFAATNDLTQFRPTGEYRLVTRGERMTVVMMVTIGAMDALFDRIRTEVGLDIPTQPTHITIYSLQPDVGISLNSVEQVAADSHVVDIPELANL